METSAKKALAREREEPTKQNLIIILLIAAVVLLLVNLQLEKVPPTVYGASNNWGVCPGTNCIAIDRAGVA